MYSARELSPLARLHLTRRHMDTNDIDVIEAPAHGRVRKSRTPIYPHIRAEWLHQFKEGIRLGKSRLDIYEAIGKMYGRDPGVVRLTIRRLLPTTDIATDLLRAKAHHLTRRLIRKANTTEILDILSRPNIGVLEPIKKVDSGSGNIIIGVSMESCGAVNIGVQHGENERNRPEAPTAQIGGASGEETRPRAFDTDEYPAPERAAGPAVLDIEPVVEDAPRERQQRGLLGRSQHYLNAIAELQAQRQKRQVRNRREYRAKKAKKA